MPKFNINLHETVFALSNALDLVGVDHIHHGKRVAYIAAECGKRLGWIIPRQDDLFRAAMLHDCGVSNTQIHARLSQLECEHEAEHCEIGANLLSSNRLLRHLSDIVRYHHTHWSELKDMDLPIEIKLTANLIYLADRVEVLFQHYQTEQSAVHSQAEIITREILEQRGGWFCPQLVDTFQQVSSAEHFWFMLDVGHVNEYLENSIPRGRDHRIEFEDLRELVQVFSHIVDAKSPFTRQHSDGVANLARFIGGLFELDGIRCEMLELAGLLHDLGKLRVPDEFLEKPGKLTEQEFAVMQRHCLDTHDILKPIRGLEEIALWASQHHERMDGSGYPQQLDAAQLSLEARILAVADVFQALAQDRPYRKPMPPGEILRILQTQAADGKLDWSVVKQIQKNLHACWLAATLNDDTLQFPYNSDAYAVSELIRQSA